MDLGGSDLESSLPQAENPCLIVEDSQPDSVALEDDPDTSYRALLARRLSNLQPTSHSPVLELISSPFKRKCSKTDGNCEKSNGSPQPGNLQTNQSSASAEHSQVFEVCSYPSNKRSDQESMESRADSTTQCAPTEGTCIEGMSQFGLLELSESQGAFDDSQRREIGDEDVKATSANLLPDDSQKSSVQSGLKSSSAADSQSKRPEVSSSSTSASQSKDGRELSVRAILHSQAEDDEDDEMMSSQDDLFDGESNGSKVDSTGSELESQPQWGICTPAHSLRLLHLSGQGTLVQESLSQQSVDFVAGTQDNLNQTPLIVPNSPTGQENEDDCNKAADSTKDTPASSRHDQIQGKQDVPMEVEAVPKSTSASLSQKSFGSVVEKSLSLPSQPEFSHDVFVPTPSLEAGDCSQAPEALKKEEAQKRNPSTLNVDSFNKPTESQPAELAASLHLELESGNSVFDKRTQVFAVDEDSQATQIQNIQGTVGADQTSSVLADNNKKAAGLHKATNSQEVPQEPDPRSSSQQLPSQPVCEVEAKSQEPQAKAEADIPAPISPQSKSVICSHQASEKEQGEHNLSQPKSQRYELATKDEDQEEDEEVQSTNRAEGSWLDRGLSQSQVDSSEPMEVSGNQPAGSHKEDSFRDMDLEDSQRLSQDQGQKSQAFRSSSQPVRSLQKEKIESGREMTPCSQPSSSGQVSITAGPQASDGGMQGATVSNRSLSDSSGDLPFHFTLPREGDLIKPAASATPAHVRQLKNTPLHSTPIETSTYREREEANSTREATMASEISVEESGEAEEPVAERADGKLSLRMKLVSPVEEGSSECFSLQKPSLSDEESSVAKATTVAKAVTRPQSVFTRVREAHRQLQVEKEEMEPKNVSIRPMSQADIVPSLDSPLKTVGTTDQSSQQPNGTTAANSEPLVEMQVSTGNETPSTSGQAQVITPPGQRAPLQQTSVNSSSTNSPTSRRAVSQQTTFDASGPQLPPSRGDPVTPNRSQSGPSLRRHVRTIQEVRTTVTRIITDVYYEDGKEVDRKMVEESEEPVVDRCVMDSDVSPSRTGSSMTSGDLADVSSLSSKAASHYSSSGTSSGGPAPSRMTDFIMPPSRVPKIGSPRKGGRPAVGLVLAGGLASPATALLSPQGHGRRGRPPSRSPLPRGGRPGHRGGAHGQAVSSSEEELLARPNAHIPSNLSDVHTTSPENSSSRSSFVGLRVMAKWSSNSFFYSGTIAQDLGENHFRLLFDDNQECEAQGKDILLCDPIPLETEVTALTEEEYFNTGTVKGHKRQGAELLYNIEKDGQSSWYSRTAVILTLEQGNRLREQFGLGPYEPSTPQNMASDISLDNLVEGKRRRRGNGGPRTPNSSSTNSPRTPAKRKLASTTEDEQTPTKRGRRGGGARAGLTAAACNTSGSGADLPADPDDLLVSHGPLPESASLFMGFVFMLTTSSEVDRESNLTGDGDDDCVQTAPFNKQYTGRQLEAGGGMILPEFNEEQCKAAYQSLLIADQHCRTRTYLLCVAGGVPCVSQIWVKDCCKEKKLMNYRNYLLPAGLGPENRLIEWHGRSNPFKALKVLLIAEKRVDLWAALLNMCGAAKVQQHKRNNNGSDMVAEKFDVVVSASPCPAELLKCATDAGTPVVSLEWLVQCVIGGEHLAYDSQPEYHHNHSS